MRICIEGRGGIFIGRRGNVVDPTRNNHRKWKHDVGHDIEAVSVLLSHDSTTASSAALLRRPSILPIPGNLSPIPVATRPRFPLVLASSYHVIIIIPFVNRFLINRYIYIYVCIYPINRIYSNRLNVDGRLIICVACRDYRWMTSEWMENGNWRKLLLKRPQFFLFHQCFSNKWTILRVLCAVFSPNGDGIVRFFVQEELFRFHVQWKELIDSLFDRFWFKDTLRLMLCTYYYTSYWHSCL